MPGRPGRCRNRPSRGGERCDCELDEHGDHAVGGVLLTATKLVNAIPAVCEAGPGFLTALDLPMVTGRGLLAR